MRATPKLAESVSSDSLRRSPEQVSSQISPNSSGSVSREGSSDTFDGSLTGSSKASQSPAPLNPTENPDFRAIMHPDKTATGTNPLQAAMKAGDSDKALQLYNMTMNTLKNSTVRPETGEPPTEEDMQENGKLLASHAFYLLRGANKANPKILADTLMKMADSDSGFARSLGPKLKELADAEPRFMKALPEDVQQAIRES